MAKAHREVTDTVVNHDILFIHDMTNRFIEELMHSQSNGINGMLIHDQDRINTYLVALRVKRDWINSQPILDLPETHPREWKLTESPEVLDVENETVNQFIRLLEALRIEMVNSASARLSSTLLPADLGRFDGIVSKMQTFLDDYVAVATPLDFPESSPSKDLATAGNKGS